MRFVILDLIRSVAILSIVVSHVGSVTRPQFATTVFSIGHIYDLAIGGIGVTILLVLSGLALELKYKACPIAYRHFVGKRLMRIYPTYYLALLLGIALYFGKKYYYTGHFLLPSSVFDLIGSFTGFYAFLGRWGGPFVGTSWFIGVIVTMYLMYPYIAKIMRRNPHIVISLLFLISIVSREVLRQYSHFYGSYGSFLWRSIGWFPLCRVFEFSLGIYLADITKERLWRCMDGFREGKSIIGFMAQISFPMFLVHHPLLFLIPFLSGRGVHQFVAVIVYLGVCTALSWMILVVDKYIRGRITLEELMRRSSEVPVAY